MVGKYPLDPSKIVNPDMLPMEPVKGPPLPKKFRIHWPWVKSK